MQLSKQTKPRGQGLLEVIIALGVLVAGTAGSVTLIIATISAGRQSANKIVAANLAREAIEVVRNIRDSNWLAMQAGDILITSTFQDIATSVNNHYAVLVADQLHTSWTINHLSNVPDPTSDDLAFSFDCSTWKCSRVFFNNSKGFYQTTATDPGSDASAFQRILKIEPICRADANIIDGIPDVISPIEQIKSVTSTENCGANQLLVGLRVQALVKWQGGSYTLEDRLYNWKYLQ